MVFILPNKHQLHLAPKKLVLLTLQPMYLSPHRLRLTLILPIQAQSLVSRCSLIIPQVTPWDYACHLSICHAIRNCVSGLAHAKNFLAHHSNSVSTTQQFRFATGAKHPSHGRHRTKKKWSPIKCHSLSFLNISMGMLQWNVNGFCTMLLHL